MNTNVTTKGQWLELTRLCEGASESRMYIDEVIWLALDAGVDLDHAERKAPKVTSSIDAITALIERELAPISVDLQIRPKDAYARLWLHSRNDLSIRQAATPALALCAAFCRAMAEKVA